MYFACLRIMNETDVRDTINVLAAIVNHANREFVGSFIKRQRVEVRRAAAARERDASAAVKYVLRDIEARTTEVHSESYGCSYASLSTINTPILQD